METRTRLNKSELEHTLKAFITFNFIIYNFGWKQPSVEPIPQRQPFVTFSTKSKPSPSLPSRPKGNPLPTQPCAYLYPELAIALADSKIKIHCSKVKNAQNTIFIDRITHAKNRHLSSEDSGRHFAVAAGSILQATELWQTLIIFVDKAVTRWIHYHRNATQHYPLTPLPEDPRKINTYHYQERVKLIRENMHPFQLYLAGHNKMLNAILKPWIHSHNRYDSPHPLHVIVNCNWFHKLVNYLQANFNKKHHRTFLISHDPLEWTLLFSNCEPKHRCAPTSSHITSHHRTPNSAKQFARAITRNRVVPPKQPSEAFRCILLENRMTQKLPLSDSPSTPLPPPCLKNAQVKLNRQEVAWLPCSCGH